MKRTPKTIHLSLQDLADYLGCHRNTIHNRMKKHNLTLKKLNKVEFLHRFLNDYKTKEEMK